MTLPTYNNSELNKNYENVSDIVVTKNLKEEDTYRKYCPVVKED